jgi:hypothetical protein
MGADSAAALRLDEHHLTLTEYLADKPSRAPLDELRPGRILELGWVTLWCVFFNSWF